MDPKINTIDLDFFYGGKQAIKKVKLSIREKSITAIMGPSGCGKTTFLRTLNRMTDTMPGTRLSGRVLLDGVDIYLPDTDIVQVRRRVGMVFQYPNPLPKSIFENVVFGPKVLGINHKERLAETAERSLKSANLWNEVKDCLDKSALALSGGQQQRLCIARALALNPEVILMDEPCSSLDPTATIKIEELMQDLKKNYTIVTVTHNMQQAARVSDWTAFFLLGELIEYGPTRQLFSNPADKRTEAYINGRFG